VSLVSMTVAIGGLFGRRGAGCRDRTDDIFFTREVLCQLS
jgi:hypothetical protein